MYSKVNSIVFHNDSDYEVDGDRKSAKQTTSFQLNAQVERHVHVSGMAAMMEIVEGGVWDVCHSGFTISKRTTYG